MPSWTCRGCSRHQWCTAAADGLGSTECSKATISYNWPNVGSAAAADGLGQAWTKRSHCKSCLITVSDFSLIREQHILIWRHQFASCMRRAFMFHPWRLFNHVFFEAVDAEPAEAPKDPVPTAPAPAVAAVTWILECLKPLFFWLTAVLQFSTLVVQMYGSVLLWAEVLHICCSQCSGFTGTKGKSRHAGRNCTRNFIADQSRLNSHLAVPRITKCIMSEKWTYQFPTEFFWGNFGLDCKELAQPEQHGASSFDSSSQGAEGRQSSSCIQCTGSIEREFESPEDVTRSIAWKAVWRKWYQQSPFGFDHYACWVRQWPQLVELYLPVATRAGQRASWQTMLGANDRTTNHQPLRGRWGKVCHQCQEGKWADRSRQEQPWTWNIPHVPGKEGTEPHQSQQCLELHKSVFIPEASFTLWCFMFDLPGQT